MVSFRTVLITSCFILFCSFIPNKFDYIFRISTSLNGDNLPKDLTVEVINNERASIKLNNLVFHFYVDNDGYWATCDEARFLDPALIVKSKANFKQTISIDSLAFTSFDKKLPVPVKEIKKRLMNSKSVRIKATISDIRRLEDPLSSSSLTHSNVIELRTK